ncbi:hypothetical protein ACFM35_04415 [Microbacterium sp. P01]|uniref:hypothetical protein n=1 Tax=unclassified Microbacterium TaxID=2609290 RepID=UPI00366F31EB
MDENTRAGKQPAPRPSRILALAVVAAGGVVVGVVAGFVTQSVVIGLVAGLIVAGIAALWVRRVRRVGENTGDMNDLAEERRLRRDQGPFTQPGSSGFGTPGI